MDEWVYCLMSGMEDLGSLLTQNKSSSKPIIVGGGSGGRLGSILAIGEDDEEKMIIWYLHKSKLYASFFAKLS